MDRDEGGAGGSSAVVIFLIINGRGWLACGRGEHKVHCYLG